MIILDILIFISIFLSLIFIFDFFTKIKDKIILFLFKSRLPKDNNTMQWLTIMSNDKFFLLLKIIIDATKKVKDNIEKSYDIYLEKNKLEDEDFDSNIYDFFSGNFEIDNNYFFFSAQIKKENGFVIIIKDLKSNTGFLINNELLFSMRDTLSKSIDNDLGIDEIKDSFSNKFDGNSIGDIKVAYKLNKLMKRIENIRFSNIVSSIYKFVEIDEFNRAYIENCLKEE